jgi:cytoskeletal protein CcmA (bactofilin family)
MADATAGDSQAGSYLNSGAFFKGVLRSSRSIGIDGVLEGEIDTGADVVVGREAEIRGDIKADTVIVSGTVNGNITCASLEVEQTARVTGNLTPGRLLIAAGAMFRGQSLMGEEPSERRPESSPES